jgi:hypothetical protein
MIAGRTTITVRVTPEEQTLLAQWQERITRQAFSPGVVGVGQIAVMGAAGDEPVYWPRITSLAVLDDLAPDERCAAQYAQRVADAQRNAPGRALFAIQPGQGTGWPTATLDLTASHDLLILIAQQGG